MSYSIKGTGYNPSSFLDAMRIADYLSEDGRNRNVIDSSTGKVLYVGKDRIEEHYNYYRMLKKAKKND